MLLASLLLGLVGIVPAAPVPQGGPEFVRVAPGVELGERQPAQGPEGSRYRVEAGRLLRAVGEGPEVQLGCTLAGGPGEVTAWTHHPGGTTFVAAERGLFTVSVAGAPGTEVSELDPLGLREGPKGRPVGVVFDGRRLWVATEDEFGCAETAQLFWRGFTEADGLPPGPYSGLSAAEGGGVLLEAGGELFRYLPDRGPPPRVVVKTVEAGRFDPADREWRFELAADGRFALQLEHDTLGAPSFFWRVHDHHMWRPLEVDGAGHAMAGPLEPGSHSVQVVAFDRDLRRSPPVVLRLRVPYPRALGKAVLVPGAIGGALAVLLLCLALARRAGGGRARTTKALLSTFVILAVGLQVIAGLAGHGRSWPFVGFTMYTNAQPPMGQVFRMALYGLRADGSRTPRPIESFGAGYGLFDLRRTLTPLIHGTDAQRLKFLEQLNADRAGRPLQGFVILDERQRLTEHGPVRVSPTVMCLYSPGEER